MVFINRLSEAMPYSMASLFGYTLCDTSKTGGRLNTIKTQMKSICTPSPWLLL